MARVDHRLNRETAARHLAALDRPGIPHLFTLIPEAPGALGSVRHLHGTLAEVADRLDAAQREGCGVFVTVNALRAPRRIKANVVRIRAVWRELDGPSPCCLALAASLRVRTSPGRGHDYLLCNPADPPTPTEGERINRVLAAEYGGDKQGCDIARVLRLADSWHLKREPFRVEIIGGCGVRYSRAELLNAFPVAAPAPRAKIRPAQVDCSDRYLTATVNTLLTELAYAPPGSRNGTLNRAAFRLGQLGLEIEAASGYLRATAIATGLGELEVDRTIVSGVTAGAAHPRGRAAA